MDFDFSSMNDSNRSNGASQYHLQMTVNESQTVEDVAMLRGTRRIRQSAIPVRVIVYV